MKLGKLSLVAVMALGTSVFAIDNVKVDGEAKVWYQTSEYSGNGATATATGDVDHPTQADQDFFNKGTNSMALTALKFGASAGLAENLSGAVKVTAVSTLGLENNMVGDVPTVKTKMDGTATTVAERVQDQAWVEVLNLKYATKNFDVAAGRMALQTPLCFTETWNAVDNTFEGAVAHGYFVPDTILALAWVGKHNGVGLLGAGRGSTVAWNGEFGNFASEGAYAAAIINKSLPNTTAQAWYYNVGNVADAFWLQADAKLMGMVDLGVQYAGMNPDDSSSILASNAESTDVLSVKAAADVGPVNVYAAYSTVDEGALGFANVATGDKSMVYTTLGSIYMDGEIVVAPDTDAWKVGASTKMVPGVTLAASYCEADQGTNNATRAETDYSAWDVSATGKVGPIGLTAIYTQFEKDVKASDTADKDTDTLRIIASLKF